MARTSSSPRPASPVSAKMRIPKDQAKLLDSSASWIGSLRTSNPRLGLVNLPTDVLTSLIDFHRGLHRNDLNAREAEDSGKHKHRGNGGFRKPEEGANEQEPAPASPTPEAGATESPAATEGAATEKGTPAVNHDYDNSQQQQPDSSPSAPSSISWSPSPDRDRLRRDFPWTVIPPQPPTSSLDVEEELEVVAPRGVRDTGAATNGETDGRLPSSLSNASSRAPPCGQGEFLIQVDDVDEEPEEDTADELKPMEEPAGVPGRRGRRMQPPAPFSSDPVNLEKTAYLGNRFATARIPPAASHLSLLESSQASVASSNAPSSPVKETQNRLVTEKMPPAASHLSLLDSSQASVPRRGAPASPAQDSPTSPVKYRPTSPVGDNQTSSGDSSGPGKAPNPQTPNAGSNDEAPSQVVSSAHRKQPNPQAPDADLNDEPSSKRPRLSHQSAGREVLVSATPLGTQPRPFSAGTMAPSVPHARPFDVYKQSYPMYQGNILEFIRACIILDYLQKEDLMRDILYDDFIHAYWGGYIDYCARTADPLGADRWFNRLGGNIIFQKRVVTRQNLHLVFATYPDVTRAVNTYQSPPRQAPTRTPTPTHSRPGSAQQTRTQFRQATTPTPKGHLEQHVPGTQPRVSRAASDAGVLWNRTPSSQHSGTMRYGDSPFVASPAAPVVVPATQSPTPMATSQGSHLVSIQNSQPQLKRKQFHQQTPHSVVAESPFKWAAASMDQQRQSLPPHRHLVGGAVSRTGPVLEERAATLSISRIASTGVAPVGIWARSSDTTTPTGAHVSKKAKTTRQPQDADNQYDRPSAESGTLHACGSGSGSAGHSVGRNSDLARPSRPLPKRKESIEMEDIGMHSFERRKTRSPDLHSPASASLASPKPNGAGDGPGSESPAPVEAQSAAKSTTGVIGKEKEPQRSRHSIATSKPHASSGNDTLKKVSSGRVGKDAGRKSSGSKDGKKKKKKKKKPARSEALVEHIRNHRAKMAAKAAAGSASPASMP